MPWGYAAAAVGTYLAADSSSSGAKSAARTQANAAANASQTQWNIFQATNHNQQPYMNAGYGASDVLSRLLGIRTTAADAPANAGVNFGSGSGPTSNFRLGGPNDAGVRVGPRLSTTGQPGGSGPVYNSDGTLNEAGSRGSPIGPGYGGSGQGAQTPFSWSADTSGYAGIQRPNLGDDVNLPDGYLTQTFGPEQFAAGIDPGYGWRFQQGMQAVMNGSAPGVGSLSGPALKALIDYGQGEASQEYGNAFNRFQTQQGNIFQRLSSIASLGQNAAANVGNQGVATGGNIGANIVGAGNAMAAGQVGSANAWSNATSSLASLGYMYAQNQGGK
jgi:hypothetical protein